MRKKRNYWTKERAVDVALEFNNKRDFKKKYIGAYELLRKNGWLNEACSHMSNITHPIKWTFEKCKKEALKYETKVIFRKNCSWGYSVAKRNGWLNEITSHMIKFKHVTPIKWTFEKCKKEALKYSNRNEFYLNSTKAYAACIRNNWLNDVCDHMNTPYSSSFKWNKKTCAKIASKYNYRNEFRKNNINAYYSAMYNGWLDEICQHMQYKKLPNRHWHSFDNCKNKALEYKTKTDFIKNAQHVYGISLKNGWLDEICKHMIPRGDKYHRCIYSYEFEDNHVYVGLTYNLNKRKIGRKKDIHDAVTIHINKTNLNPKIEQLTNYIPVKEAIKMEKYYYDKYLSEGWNLLNRTKTGSLGGSRFQ